MSVVKYNKQLLLFPFVLVFLEMVTFLSTDMYLPALPILLEDFNITQDIAQYTLSFWFLGSMSMQLILGPMTEKYGRKPILTIAIIIFILSSFICSYTDNIN